MFFFSFLNFDLVTGFIQCSTLECKWKIFLINYDLLISLDSDVEKIN